MDEDCSGKLPLVIAYWRVGLILFFMSNTKNDNGVFAGEFLEQTGSATCLIS